MKPAKLTILAMPQLVPQQLATELHFHMPPNNIIHLCLQITHNPVVNKSITFWVNFNQLCNLLLLIDMK
jgi:hypothetical protein